MSLGAKASGMVKPVIVAGLIVCLALVGQMDVISNITGALSDKDMMVRWSSALAGATHEATPVTLIDIDDATLAALGNPDRTPRDTLADLIGLAAGKRPTGLFIDLDTSRPSPMAEADRRLIDFVAGYPAEAPPLAFARRFVEQPGAQAVSELGLVPLPSFLDPVLGVRRNVALISSATKRDSDRVIRRWQLTQTICSGMEGRTYPSPQLFAASTSAGPALMAPYLNWQTRRTCAANNEAAPPWPRNPDQTAAIWFVLGADPDALLPRSIVREGRADPLVWRISARTLIGADGRVVPARAVSDQVFTGRFVVIGSSHAESFDTHMTPLGPMSGALVIANAIATAPATLTALPMSPLARTLAALVIFGFLAMTTAKLRAIVAGLVAGLLLIAILAVLGRVLAPSTAVEIVFTAVAMLALFSGIESMLEVARGWRSGLGWRAFMKASAQGRSGTPG